MSHTLEWEIPSKKQALYASQEGLAIPKCLTNFLNTVHVAIKETTVLLIVCCYMIPLNCIKTRAVKERTRQQKIWAQSRTVMMSS